MCVGIETMEVGAVHCQTVDCKLIDLILTLFGRTLRSLVAHWFPIRRPLVYESLPAGFRLAVSGFRIAVLWCPNRGSWFPERGFRIGAWFLNRGFRLGCIPEGMHQRHPKLLQNLPP